MSSKSCTMRKEYSRELHYSRMAGQRDFARIRRHQDSPELWIDDLPVFIRETHDYGYICEATFERLGYPVDEDCHATKHHLPDTFSTQPHRLRFTLITHDDLRDLFLEHT